MRRRIAGMFCDFVIGDCKSRCNCKDASSLRTKRHFCPPFPDGYRGQPCEEHGKWTSYRFLPAPSRPSNRLPVPSFPQTSFAYLQICSGWAPQVVCLDSMPQNMPWKSWSRDALWLSILSAPRKGSKRAQSGSQEVQIVLNSRKIASVPWARVFPSLRMSGVLLILTYSNIKSEQNHLFSKNGQSNKAKKKVRRKTISSTFPDSTIDMVSRNQRISQLHARLRAKEICRSVAKTIWE